MLKSTNHGKDLFFQETSQLFATQGGPNIKERRLFAATSLKPVIFFYGNQAKQRVFVLRSSF